MTDLRLREAMTRTRVQALQAEVERLNALLEAGLLGRIQGFWRQNLSRGLRRHSGWQSIGTFRMSGSRLPGSETGKPPGRGESGTDKGTISRQTGAALLAIGIANTTRSGVGRWRRRKSRVTRLGFAGLFLLALTVIAVYLGS